MKLAIGICLGLFLFPLCACEEAGFVDKAKYDKVSQENVALKKQLAQKEDEIKQLPHHHYSLHREGLRTFRFDADTGKTCIQLTTQQDWKNADTKSESCDCQDLLSETGVGQADETRKLYCGW